MQIRNRKVVGFITNKEIEIEIERKNFIEEKTDGTFIWNLRSKNTTAWVLVHFTENF
jgi:hypothetical protein